MATKRKSWLRTGILAVSGLGIIYGAQSFTDKKEVKAEKKLVNQTWYFTGSSSDDPTDPSLYSTTPPNGQPCDQETEVICQVQAPDDGSGKPDMQASVGSSTIENQIIIAHNSLATPNPQLNSTVTAFRSE